MLHWANQIDQEEISNQSVRGCACIKSVGGPCMLIMESTFFLCTAVVVQYSNDVTRSTNEQQVIQFGIEHTSARQGLI
jgi:hypothetical protein